MPNELNIALATTGLTVTAQPYQAGAAVGSAISCPEVGSTGFYSGNMTGTAGTYQLTFLASGANVGSGSIVWDGTAEVAPSTLTAAQVRTELSTELGRIDAAISSRLAPSGTLATVTNLTNAPASVTPADIWSHATRTITGGTVDTLTNAPSVPSATTIASQVRTELSTELGRLDATVSSRLASASYTAPANSDITAIKAKTDALPSDPADQSLLEAAIAGVTAPSASTVASAVRTELATELARVDAAISTRATPANIPTADITAIKAKTDALNTDRLAQCSTVATTGSQLAAALS
jgi:hypothetical protein